MIRSQCLNCGSKDHFASRCPKPLAVAKYPCTCGKCVSVTARGQTVIEKPTAAPSSSSPAGALARAAAPREQLAPPEQPPLVLANRKRRVEATGSGAVLTFDSIWQHPQKFRRKASFGSLADLLALMNTGAANRAKGRPGEKVKVWRKRYGWRADTDYKTEIQEFASKPGGGSPGVGLGKAAAKQIYSELNKA